MTAMGLFAHGLNRDGGELAQGAVDCRLLRRVLLPLKVFLRRLVGKRSFLGQRIRSRVEIRRAQQLGSGLAVSAFPLDVPV